MAALSQSSTSFKKIKAFFRRFHLTVFFVFIISCLVGAVYIINQTLEQSDDVSNQATTNVKPTVDPLIVTRLQTLHTSGITNDQPAGRANPFNE